MKTAAGAPAASRAWTLRLPAGWAFDGGGDAAAFDPGQDSGPEPRVFRFSGAYREA